MKLVHLFVKEPSQLSNRAPVRIYVFNLAEAFCNINNCRQITYTNTFNCSLASIVFLVPCEG